MYRKIRDRVGRHLIVLLILAAVAIASTSLAQVAQPAPSQANDDDDPDPWMELMREWQFGDTDRIAEREAGPLERRIDTLILRRDYSQAQELLDRALTQYPTHEGLLASQEWLASNQYWERQAVVIVAVVLAIVALCAAAVIVLLCRGRPLVAASVYTTSVYVFSVPLAFMLAMFFAMAEAMKQGGVLSSVAEHALLISMACFLGALGGALNCSFLLQRRSKDLVPEEGTFSYFFFKPLNGFFLAAVMYIAILSGDVAIYGKSDKRPEIWAIALLAVLTGIFSEAAIRKLRELSQSFFGEQGRRGGTPEMS